jgi:hypothetical protein
LLPPCGELQVEQAVIEPSPKAGQHENGPPPALSREKVERRFEVGYVLLRGQPDNTRTFRIQPCQRAWRNGIGIADKHVGGQAQLIYHCEASIDGDQK